MFTGRQLFAIPCSSQGVVSLADSQPGNYFHSMVYRAVLRLDVALRANLGIFEFSNDPDCLLRIAITQSKLGAVLSDGTNVREGDSVVELPFWNEHVAALVASQHSLARAKSICRLLHHS